MDKSIGFADELMGPLRFTDNTKSVGIHIWGPAPNTKSVGIHIWSSAPNTKNLGSEGAVTESIKFYQNAVV
jgi:hypothetical protein